MILVSAKVDMVDYKCLKLNILVDLILLSNMRVVNYCMFFWWSTYARRNFEFNANGQNFFCFINSSSSNFLFSLYSAILM